VVDEEPEAEVDAVRGWKIDASLGFAPFVIGVEDADAGDLVGSTGSSSSDSALLFFCVADVTSDCEARFMAIDLIGGSELASLALRAAPRALVNVAR